MFGRPAVLHGKNFYVGHYMQLFNFTFFIPAMLTGTIDFHHLIPLPPTLTLPEGHKVSANQNVMASFSRTPSS